MLNVSHTTVSRSLNDSPLISKETKDKVKEIARQHN
jgi:LacI family transcriptional regulator